MCTPNNRVLKYIKQTDRTEGKRVIQNSDLNTPLLIITTRQKINTGLKQNYKPTELKTHTQKPPSE